MINELFVVERQLCKVVILKQKASMMNRKMNVTKRIAFAAGDINRKSLIEWSYYNQDILKNHELIATGVTADILEGTIGVTVTRLTDGNSSANQQLAAMIAEQKIDILLFFWEPSQSFHAGDTRFLYDMAVAYNTIVAANLATADFVLSSALMNKTHSVPVGAWPVYSNRPGTGGPGHTTTQPMLKVNFIN
jgi:methylglyoxal synthase